MDIDRAPRLDNPPETGVLPDTQEGGDEGRVSSAASTTSADDLVQLLIDLDSHWREGKALADRLTRLLDQEDERTAARDS